MTEHCYNWPNCDVRGPHSEAVCRHPGDAWKQLDDLEEKYTEEVEVRPDLVVTALGLERGVMFTLIETDHNYDTLDKRHYRSHSTQRNVSTMRELAQALLDACDFVEQANPQWAQLPDGRVARAKQVTASGNS